MSSLYFVESTDGSFSFVVQPATLNGPTATLHTTDLKFYGSGTYGWANGYSQNFFRLLENFACPEKTPSLVIEPKTDGELGLNKGINDPVVGQLWFNKTRNRLFVFDGSIWVPVGYEIGISAPPSPTIGQLWFDTTDNYTSPVNNYTANGVLKMYNGTSFVDVAAPIVDTLYPRTGGTVYGGISTGGETSPDTDSGGICINHGSSDGSSLTFKNSDVNHPFTGIVEADTYGFIRKQSSTAGGLSISGVTETSIGLEFKGYAVTPNTTPGTGGVFWFNGFKNIGVGTTAIADGENLFSVANVGSNKLLVKGNGDTYVSGTLDVVGNVTSIDPTTPTHLATKNYVDVEIASVSTSLFEPVSGNWHNDGFLKVHTDGGTEVGSYIDFHQNDVGVSNYDMRMILTTNVETHTELQFCGIDTNKGLLRFDTIDGSLHVRSDINSTNPTLTFSDYNVSVADLNYPNPADKEYLSFSKVDSTNGGARIRGYYRNGNTGQSALVLEGVKSDNGQTTSEPGAVSVNAYRYVGGVGSSIVSTDNAFTVANNGSVRLVVKGDGKVITNGAAITDSNQLTTKSYVDFLVTVVNNNVSDLDTRVTDLENESTSLPKIVAKANISFAGVITNGKGISSVVHSGTGEYQVYLTQSYTDLVGVSNPIQINDRNYSSVSNIISSNHIQVNTWVLSGGGSISAGDADFSLIVTAD